MQKGGFLNEKIFDIDTDKVTDYNSIINDEIEANNSIDNTSILVNKNINPEINKYFEKSNPELYSKINDVVSKIQLILSRIIPFYNSNKIFENIAQSTNMYIKKDKILYVLSDNNAPNENKYMINNKLNLSIIDYSITNIVNKEFIPLNHIANTPDIKYIFMSMLYEEAILSSFINMVEIKDGIVVLKDVIKNNKTIKPYCDMIFQNLFIFRILEDGKTITCKSTKSFQNILTIFILTGDLHCVYILCNSFKNISEDIILNTESNDIIFKINKKDVNNIKKIMDIMKKILIKNIYNPKQSVLHNIDYINNIIKNRIKIIIIDDVIEDMEDGLLDIDNINNKYGLNLQSYNDIDMINSNPKFTEITTSLNSRLTDLKQHLNEDRVRFSHIINEPKYKIFIDNFIKTHDSKNKQSKISQEEIDERKRESNKRKQLEKEETLRKSDKDKTQKSEKDTSVQTVVLSEYDSKFPKLSRGGGPNKESNNILTVIIKNINKFKDALVDSRLSDTYDITNIIDMIRMKEEQLNKLIDEIKFLDPDNLKNIKIYKIIFEKIKALKTTYNEYQEKLNTQQSHYDSLKKGKTHKDILYSKRNNYDNTSTIEGYISQIKDIHTKINNKIEYLQKIPFNEYIKYKIEKLNTKKSNEPVISTDTILLVLQIISEIMRVTNNNILDLIYYYNFYNMVEICYRLIDRKESKKALNDITNLNKIINLKKEYIYIELLFEIINFVYMIKECATIDMILTYHILDSFISSTLQLLNNTSNFNINIITHSISDDRFIEDDYANHGENLNYGLNTNVVLNNFLHFNTSFYLYGQGNMEPSVYFKSSRTQGDCGESTLFNLINYLIYNKTTKLLDWTILPNTTIPGLIELYKKYNTVDLVQENRNKFYSILHDMTFIYVPAQSLQEADIEMIYVDIYNLDNNKVQYSSITPIYKGFNMRPSYYTFTRVFNRLFGVNKNLFETENLFQIITTDSLKNIINTFNTQPISYTVINFGINSGAGQFKINDLIVMLNSGHADFTNRSRFVKTSKITLYNIGLSDIAKSLNLKRNAYLYFNNTVGLFDKNIILKLYLINYVVLFSDKCYNYISKLLKTLINLHIKQKDNYKESMFLDDVIQSEGADISIIDEIEFFELYKALIDLYADNIKNNYENYEINFYIDENVDRFKPPLILSPIDVLQIDLGMYYKCKYFKYYIDKFKFIKPKIIYKIISISNIGKKSLDYYIMIYRDNFDKLREHTEFSTKYQKNLAFGFKLIIDKIFLYKKNDTEPFHVYFNNIYNTDYNNESLIDFYKIIILYYLIYWQNISKIHRFDFIDFNYSNYEYILYLLNVKSPSNNKNVFRYNNTVFDLNKLTGLDLINYIDNMSWFYHYDMTTGEMDSLSSKKYINKEGKLDYKKIFKSAKEVMMFIIKFPSTSSNINIEEKFVENFNTYYKTFYDKTKLLDVYNIIYNMYKKLFYQECIAILTTKKKDIYMIESKEDQKTITKGPLKGTIINITHEYYRYIVLTNNEVDLISKKYKKFFGDKFYDFEHEMTDYTVIPMGDNKELRKHIKLEIILRNRNN